MSRLIAHAICLLATVASPLAAQSAGGGFQDPVTVSPFDPIPGGGGVLDTGGNGGGGGGGGGGQGFVPGDATNPIGSPDQSQPLPENNSGGGVLRGSSGRAARAPQTTGATPRSTVTVNGLAGSANQSWRAWWETNKFDFIDLHRVTDDPFGGQGRYAETAAEKAERLAAMQLVLRDEVTPVLRALTEADDPAVRGSAIVALGKLGDHESASLARTLLRDRSLTVRRAAMLSLGVLDAGRASYLLVNIAADSSVGHDLLQGRPSDEDRATAMLSGALRRNPAQEHLLDELFETRDDLSPELLAVTCEAAGLMGSRRCLTGLSSVAMDDDLPEFVRSAAITALGRIGDPAAIPAMLELLDEGLQPRRAATIALGYLAHPGMVGVIEALDDRMVDDSDEATRHFAAIALGRIGGPAARARLERAFLRPRADMRPWLALGLGLCERSSPTGELASRLLERASEEGNVETLGAYLVAIGLSGDTESLDVLAHHALTGSPDVAAHAAMALGLSQMPDARPILQDVLAGARSPIVQRQAALALGVLGDASAVPDLLEVMRQTSNPYVASFAAIGIAFLGDEDAVGPLLHLIKSQGPRGVATTYAVVAVGQLFDSERRPALARLAAGDNYHARSSAVSQLLALGF